MKVAILMGSDSDLPVMEAAVKVLKEMGVDHEVEIMSAHRTPARAARYATEAKEKGIKVIIAGAGLAAHLAGFMAAHTTLPVIGVPLAAGTLGGQDSLLATVQMPPGIPVATVAINGARNAGILACEMLALGDARLAERLEQLRNEMANKVAAKNRTLQERNNSL